MKLFLRLTAILTGTVTVIFGLNSCKKDKNVSVRPSKLECCSFAYTVYEYTYSYKACEDGSVIYSYTYNGKTYTENYDWHDDYDSWTEVKDMILEDYSNYGARCY